MGIPTVGLALVMYHSVVKIASYSTRAYYVPGHTTTVYSGIHFCTHG